MKTFGSFIVIIAVQATSLTLLAQDSLITTFVKQSYSTFRVDKNTFKGVGWDTLVNQIQKSD